MKQGSDGQPLENVTGSHNFKFLLTVVALCSLVYGCAKPEQPVGPEPPPPPQPTQTPPPSDQPQPEDRAKLPVPQPAEVREKVERISKGAMLVRDPGRPYFFVGDFNGDLSQDVAVIVKPAEGKLAEINDELAPWIRDDALAGVLPESVVKAQSPQTRPPMVYMEESDLLLAVIHGYGGNGWRDPEAQQAYLIRNAIRGDMSVEAAKDVLSKKKGQPLPKLHGDVISGALAGQAGFLFYNGAHYVWYDPRHYKLPPPARMVH